MLSRLAVVLTQALCTMQRNNERQDADRRTKTAGKPHYYSEVETLAV
ncbi:MAG: hypothetical protein SPI30_02535 [Prevotella sp.]|nr:hypothetical protein [Prevotella sp.]